MGLPLLLSHISPSLHPATVPFPQSAGGSALPAPALSPSCFSHRGGGAGLIGMSAAAAEGTSLGYSMPTHSSLYLDAGPICARHGDLFLTSAHHPQLKEHAPEA